MEEKLLEQLILVTNELVMQIALRFNYSDFENIRENHPLVSKAVAVIKEAQENKIGE